MKRPFRRLRAATAIVTTPLLIGAAVGTASPASAATTVAPAVQVMQFNYCGTDCTPAHPAHSAVSDVNFISAVTLNHPWVITLEEVCSAQIPTIQSEIGFPTDSSHFYFYKKLTTTKCAGDQQRGTAILSRAALSGKTGIVMPVTVGSGVQDTIACARASIGSPAVASEICVTHLDAQGAATKQLSGTSSWEGAAAWAMDQANTVSLIFAGDFNLVPTDAAIAQVEKNVIKNGDSTKTTGQHFQEIDSTNKATWSTFKYDYIFFKQSYAKNMKANASSPQTVASSDHKVLYGVADICSANTC